MRKSAIIVVGMLGAGVFASAANALPTATAAVPAPETANIIQVYGGCGPGGHPVPPHYNRWGRYIPGHCAPNGWYRRW